MALGELAQGFPGGVRMQPPRNEEELQFNIQSIQEWLKRPETQAGLLQFATAFGQPVPAGQTTFGHALSSINEGVQASGRVGALKQQQEAAERAEAREDRRIGLEERRTAAEEGRAAEVVRSNKAQERTAAAKLDLEKSDLEALKDYRAAELQARKDIAAGDNQATIDAANARLQATHVEAAAAMDRLVKSMGAQADAATIDQMIEHLSNLQDRQVLLPVDRQRTDDELYRQAIEDVMGFQGAISGTAAPPAEMSPDAEAFRLKQQRLQALATEPLEVLREDMKNPEMRRIVESDPDLRAIWNRRVAEGAISQADQELAVERRRRALNPDLFGPRR